MGWIPQAVIKSQAGLQLQRLTQKIKDPKLNPSQPPLIRGRSFEVSRKTLAVTVPYRHIVFSIPKIYSNIFTSRIGEKGRVSWFMNAL